MSKVRLLVATAAAVMMAAGLAACGDDDDIETGTTTTTSASAPASSSSTSTSTTSAVGRGATLDCGTVGFTPASEDAASQIKVTGVSCEEARTVVEVAGARTSPGGPQQLTVNGYQCVITRTVEDPLPLADYECTDGDKKITFTRS